MEQAALLSLLRLRNRAANKRKNPESIGLEIANAFRFGIIRLKAISRQAGYDQANRELKSIDRSFNPLPRSLTSLLINDIRESKTCSDRFATLWQSHFDSGSDSFRESARAANANSLHRLTLIAVTESSKAYNEGRNAAVESYNGSVSLFKIWDSYLDKDICSHCHSSDGETMPISEKFSYGEPGFVHPNCRCTYSIWSEAEIDSYHDLSA